MLIAIEGIDYSGKSTQVEHLVQALQDRGLTVAKWSNFYNQPHHRAWFQLMMADDPHNDAVEELLIAAYAHRRGRAGLLNALATHDVVVMDRYLLSFMTMQGMLPAIDLGEDFKREFGQVFRLLDMPRPDLEIVLELHHDAFELRRRARKDQHDTIDKKHWGSYHALLQTLFLEHSSTVEPAHQKHTLRADRKTDELAREILTLIDHALEAKEP